MWRWATRLPTACAWWNLAEAVRQLFDQYAQPENRATHALATALARDPEFLQAFCERALRSHCIPKNIRVSCQSVPGRRMPSEADAERLGLPDLWLYDGDWCLLIEAKITASLSPLQLEAHHARARKQGFSRIHVVPLTASMQADTGMVWTDVYQLVRSGVWRSIWPGLAADYLEVLEARMIADGQLTIGSLTGFSGFRFGEYGFTYGEASRLLRQAMIKLRDDARLDALGVDRTLPGRPAITGQDGPVVWDFLRLAQSKDSPHTAHPHLTIGIVDDSVEAMVTLPNGLNTKSRGALADLSSDSWNMLTRELMAGFAPLLAAQPRAVPMIRVLQRRYPSQRARPFDDAHILFDLRTATGLEPVKLQPQWFNAAIAAWTAKNSNMQIQFGMSFKLSSCPLMQKEGAVTILADVLLAMRPLLAVMGCCKDPQSC